MVVIGTNEGTDKRVVHLESHFGRKKKNRDTVKITGLGTGVVTR